MDFRASRQLTIIVVFLIIAAGAGFLIVRPYLPKPTCADNRLNQEEEETDCGGPCIPCAFKRQQDVEIFWTRFVKVRGNTYDVAARVLNPNVKLAAAKFDYEFKLFDGSGFLVASRRGSSYLYPGETAHLSEVGLISGRMVEEASIALSNFAWVLLDERRPDIIAGNREYAIESENGARYSSVKALISNRTLGDVTGAEVVVLAFDHQGNMLGANRTILDTLGANESKPVRFRWPDVFAEDVSSLVIEARTRQAISAGNQ